MRDAFKKAHDRGVEAIAGLSLPAGLGPILAVIADALLGKVVPALGATIYDALGLSDDRIGGCTIALTAKEMVLMAARGRDATFHGINHRFESPRIIGMGGEYALYFTVVPA